MADVDKKRIPKHVAIVMDGNGRWAESQGLSRTEGHKAGEESLNDIIEGAIDLGIEWITVYAFSTENWKRPVSEVKFLMSYPQEVLTRRLDKLDSMGVRVHIAGRRDKRMVKAVMNEVEAAVEKTKTNDTLNLVLAYNYGGRAEIVDAVKELVEAGTAAKDIDEEVIGKHLYVSDAPDPELVIRTSGEQRTSNFLLWQAAYSEYVFTDMLWPEFRRQDLVDAIVEYQGRQRRFGGVKH